MCGIVGFTGKREAGPILLEGLEKLEYRGYDSAGLAVQTDKSNVEIVKATGRLVHLSDKTDKGFSLKGTCGIGHTRWATHGNPTIENAHPHISGFYMGSSATHSESNVIGVHNGIIENYTELKEKLLEHGYKFYSDTDTEVVVKLVDYYLNKYKFGPMDAINRTMVRIKGSYAFAFLFKDYPGEIYAARHSSPLIIGEGKNEFFLASDVSAFIKYTRKAYYIDDMQVCHLTPDSITFYDLNGNKVSMEPAEITWDSSASEKNGYKHFMLKEIHEEPAAVRNTINQFIKGNNIEFPADSNLSDNKLTEISEIDIVACGSSYHVGIVGKHLIEELCGISVMVDVASEYRYKTFIPKQNKLVIVISQSGETADTIAAMKHAKEKGSKVLSIVNVLGSTISRESDYTLYTLAGPEIAVATTKAYSAQLAVMYLIALKTAFLKNTVSAERLKEYLTELKAIPNKIEKILEDKERLQWFSSKMINTKDAFFIGRGLDYALSLEGSLKLKEVSYIHSEAFPAGELKHGTISLIENGTPVFGILTQSRILEKTLSNLIECKSRGAYLAVITSNGNYFLENTADFTFYIPKTEEIFTPSLAVIPLQLIGYYSSVNKGLDVDKPRNLAKSVTVE